METDERVARIPDGFLSVMTQNVVKHPNVSSSSTCSSVQEKKPPVLGFEIVVFFPVRSVLCNWATDCRVDNLLPVHSDMHMLTVYVKGHAIHVFQVRLDMDRDYC